MSGITWQQGALALTIILTSTGILTFTDLFGVLFSLKGMDYNYTGDITCGAECESYINLTTSYWRVCFANYSDTKYADETLFKKVSRSRTLHVNIDNVDNIITTKKKVGDNLWLPYDIEVDWMVPTYGGKWRPIRDGDCWERGKVNKIQLVGHKKPRDTIKWGFGLEDYVDIDPVWNGINITKCWSVTDATHNSDGDVTALVNSDDGSGSDLNGKNAEYIDFLAWNDSMPVGYTVTSVNFTVDVQAVDNCWGLAVQHNKTGAYVTECSWADVDAQNPLVCGFDVSSSWTTEETNSLGVRLLSSECDAGGPDHGEVDYGYMDVAYEMEGLYVDSCAVLDQANETYKLYQDINGAQNYCINISANNITLDCQGYTIQGDDIVDFGIYVERDSPGEITNITIKNCVVSDWDTANIYMRYANQNNLTDVISTSSPDNGIHLYYSDSNTFTNITANSNNYGIYSYYSDSNTFTNITANSNNRYGIRSYHSDYNTFKNIDVLNNTNLDIEYKTSRVDFDCNAEFINVTGTDNKPIVFYNTTVNLQDWNNNVSAIILCGADGSTIDNLTIDHTDVENNALLIVATQNTNISNSEFTDLEYGIYSYYSDSNNFTNITTNSNNLNGFRVDHTDSNTFTNITANSNNYDGIYSYYSDSNNFTNITANSNNNYGIYSYYSDSNTFTNITANSNNYDGFRASYSNYNNYTNIDCHSNVETGVIIGGHSNILKDSTIHTHFAVGECGLLIYNYDNLIYNNTIYSNYHGIRLTQNTVNNTIYDNNVYNNTHGIYIHDSGDTGINLIYNNLFNQTNNTKFETVYINDWNTTEQAGTRIYSDGTDIGGNYWTNSTSTGYSDTCPDTDANGFCDDALNITNMVTCTEGVDCGDNVDYNPLSDEYLAEDEISPTYSNNGHNTTVAGNSVLFYIEYDDNIALHPDGQYIFSTNNTGTWTNESAINFTATPNWANKSMVLNSTEGLTISYRWYADDNAGNINDTSIFTLTTTSAPSDSCTYSGSGNWAIVCNDNCSLVSTDLLGNNFTITGSSDTPTTGFINLYNYDLGHISGGCTVRN